MKSELGAVSVRVKSIEDPGENVYGILGDMESNANPPVFTVIELIVCERRIAEVDSVIVTENCCPPPTVFV